MASPIKKKQAPPAQSTEQKDESAPDLVAPVHTEQEQKSKVLTSAELVEQKNKEDQKQIIQDTDELAAGIIKAAYEVQKHAEINALKEDLVNLRAALNTLKTASVLSVQPANIQRTEPSIQSGCGCEDQKQKKCCIRLFGSGIRVLKAADGIVPTLELIIAIQAGGIKAVFPGLTSQINVNANVGWVKVDWTIAKICVPCDQPMTIPLLVEAMDIDKLLSVPEKGANTGAMQVSCSCNPSSVVVDVNLSSGSMLGGEKKGQIMVEISAERVYGDCCC